MVGAAGRPAVLFSYVILLVVVASRFVPSAVAVGPQPMRWLLGLFFVSFLISYALGITRGLTASEALSIDRDLIVMIALATITLAVLDGVPSRERLDDLLLRLVGFAAVASVVGMLQFFFTYDITEFLTFPGVGLNGQEPIVAIDNRNGFNRVAATTGHAIEYGAVMAMTLPIALHYLLHDQPGRRRQLLAVATFLIAMGVPLSISRTSTVAIALMCLALAAGWSGRMLMRFSVVAVVGLVLLRAAVPSLIGSTISLFFGLEDDLSFSARTSDYPTVFRFIRERPWFGRGPGTFGPPDFLLLDNQVLSSAVNLGLIGLTLLLSLFVGAILLLRRVTWRAPRDETRHLAMSLAVSILVALVVMYFADMLFFAVWSNMTFMLFGVAGALYRMRDESSRFDVTPRWFLKSKLRSGYKPRVPLPFARPRPDAANGLND